MSLLLAFAASFGFIFLKAFQQRNVVHDNYWWVVPTSVAMAGTETIVVMNMARQGWHLPLILAIGFGSGFGAVAAMLMHKHFVMRTKNV